MASSIRRDTRRLKRARRNIGESLRQFARRMIKSHDKKLGVIAGKWLDRKGVKR